MKLKNKILSFCLSLLMISLSCFGAVAQNGGGIVKNEDYTIGVDLSVFNIGGKSVLNYDSVDFAKMKADGCDFAILRIGFEGSATRADTLDLAFIEYYNRAREAGMKLGVYFYALGTSYAEAANDASWVISVIEENDMYFEYPIYYDVEDGAHYALNGDQMTNLCLGWCETLEENGYFGGVYGRDTILNKLTDEFKSRYDLWIRHIKTADGEQYDPATLNMSESATLWQYTMLQRFDGCTVQYTENQLDGNVSYKDYESIMYENGFNNCGERDEKNQAYKKDAVLNGEIPSRLASLTDGIALARFNEENKSWVAVTPETSITLDLFGSYYLKNIKLHVSEDVTVTAVAKQAPGGESDEEITLEASTFDGSFAVIETFTLARYITFTFDKPVFIDEIFVYGESLWNKQNLAPNATYEAPAAIRGYTAILNDDVVSWTFAPGTSSWYGLFCNAAAPDENCPSGNATIMFDLGRDYALEQVTLVVGSSADVKKPDALKVRFASESEGKAAAHSNTIYTLSPDNEDDVFVAGTIVDGVCARYVEIEVNVCLIGNYWAAFNEVNIIGEEFDLDGKIEIPEEEPEQPDEIPEPEYILGDVDNNGDIDADDYILLKRIFFGMAKLENLDSPETALARCDVDGKEGITADDYILLKRVYFGMAKLG